MSRSSRRFAGFVLLTAAACLDPLYEEGAPLTSGWVVCCASGAIDTCFCDDAMSCQQPAYACAGGTCSTTPSCVTLTDAGTGGAGGGSAAGGGSGFGGGASAGGGTATHDAGVADAGVADAGATGGGGGATGGGGGATGGGTATGGGSATGGGLGTAFEFCCVQSRLSSCLCPPTGCTGAPFTPCPGGTCIAGTSAALCR